MSFYESLLDIEITIGAIYFAFLMAYTSFQSEGQFIPKNEKSLLLFTMTYIISAISIYCLIFFVTAQSEYDINLETPIPMGIALLGIWLTIALIFLQARMVIKRLNSY